MVAHHGQGSPFVGQEEMGRHLAGLKQQFRSIRIIGGEPKPSLAIELFQG